MVDTDAQNAELSPTDALAYTSTRVPRSSPSDTAGDIRRRLILADEFESVADIAVIEEERLVGMIRIERLMAAPSEATALEMMDPDPPVVAPGVNQETAAATAAMHEESCLAVVDADGLFIGLIPRHRMLGVLLEEHREDMARLGGYLHQSAAARTASRERLALRFWHRFPWLLVGLAAVLAAAAIVAAFEKGLSTRIELVFFMPGIIYIADAVGTQTETLVVRGLSIGISVRSVMRAELLTGIALGAILGLLTFPVVLLWFDAPVALTVAASIWAASAVATGVAMTLPWLFSTMGMDPAFGSGPLATVVQDLLSLTIYFVFATLIVL